LAITQKIKKTRKKQTEVAVCGADIIVNANMSAPSWLAWLPQWHSTTNRDSSNIYGNSSSSSSSNRESSNMNSSNMKHQGDSYVRWRYKSLQTARKKQKNRPTARGISISFRFSFGSTSSSSRRQADNLSSNCPHWRHRQHQG